jgi:tetratricopeptide (TPR) repeat protein
MGQQKERHSHRPLKVLLALGLFIVFGWLLVEAGVWMTEAAIRGRRLDAAKSLLSVLRFQPFYVERIERLTARHCRLTGQFKEFVEKATSALLEAPDSQWWLRERVLLYAQSGNIAETEVFLGKFLATAEPLDSREICAAYAQGYWNNLQTEKLDRLVRSWQQDFPTDPEPDYWLGMIAEASFHFQIAEKHYFNAMTKAPDKVEFSIRHASSLIDQKQFDQAKKILLAFSNEILSKSEEALSLLAACEIERGNDRKAKELLVQALHLDPSREDRHVALGLIYKRTGDTIEAIREFQIAVDLDPGHVSARYHLGTMLTRSGDKVRGEHELKQVSEMQEIDAEIQQLSKLVATNSTNGDVRRKLAILLIKANRPKQSIRWLRAALAINPKDEESRRLLNELVVHDRT